MLTCPTWRSRRNRQIEQAEARQVSQAKGFRFVVRAWRNDCQANGDRDITHTFNPVVVDFYREIGFLPMRFSITFCS